MLRLSNSHGGDQIGVEMGVLGASPPLKGYQDQYMIPLPIMKGGNEVRVWKHAEKAREEGK